MYIEKIKSPADLKKLDFNELRLGNCFHFSGMVCRACD